MKSRWVKNNWIYGVLLLSVVSAILALLTSNFIFKSGTAGRGALIILMLHFQKVKPSQATWWIFGTFLFSIAGDWFLSNMKGDSAMFMFYPVKKSYVRFNF